MTRIKLTAMAIAASVTVGALGSIANPNTAEAGYGVVKVHHKKGGFKFGRKNWRHGYGFRQHYNQYDCRFLKRRANRTGSRYWLGEYYRCLHDYR